MNNKNEETHLKMDFPRIVTVVATFLIISLITAIWGMFVRLADLERDTDSIKTELVVELRRYREFKKKVYVFMNEGERFAAKDAKIMFADMMSRCGCYNNQRRTK